MEITLFLVITTLLKVSALRDEKGHSFMVSFLKANSNDGSLYLFITAENATYVTITIPFLGQQLDYNFTTTGSIRVPLATTLRFSNWHGTSNLGIKVTSTPSEVTVMVQDYSDLSASGYMALPFDVLSTSYVAVMYDDDNDVDGFDSVILLIGIHNFTMIRVTYRVMGHCDGYVTGDEVTYFLNEYDVHGIICSGHFTGTHIVSEFPIAVINGHQKLRVTQDGQDAVQEMLLPIDQFGLSYVIFNQRAWDRGTIHRIVAAFNDTVVTTSTGISFSLNAYDYDDIDTTGLDPMCITSDKPVEIVSFTRSFHHNNMNGDNFMTIVLPTSSFGTSIHLKMQISDAISTGEYINATIIVDRRDLTYTIDSYAHDVISDCYYDVYTMPIDWPLSIYTGGFGIGLYLYGTYGVMRNGFGHPVLGNFEVCDPPCINGYCSLFITEKKCICYGYYYGNQCQYQVATETVSTASEIVHAWSYAVEESLLYTDLTMSKEDFSGYLDSMTSYSYEKSTGIYATFSDIQPSTIAGDINESLLHDSLQEITMSSSPPSGVSMSESAILGNIESSKSSIFQLSFSTSDSLKATSSLDITKASVISVLPTTSNELKVRMTIQSTGIEPSMTTVSGINDVSKTSGPPLEASATSSTSLWASFPTQGTQTAPAAPLRRLASTTDVPVEPSSTVDSSQYHSSETSASPLPSTSDSPETSTSPEETCGCICVPKPEEITPKWTRMVKLKIEKELLVETRNLSKTIRKHTSAKDDRPSAVQVGSVGIVVMVIVGLVIFLPDLFQWTVHKHHRTGMVFRLR